MTRSDTTIELNFAWAVLESASQANGDDLSHAARVTHLLERDQITSQHSLRRKTFCEKC